MKNKKLISSVIAVALAAGILLGGTFAWQSISQQALNEVYGFVNPGGRLHDDFTVMDELTEDLTKQYDKNVYVENFTTLAEDGVQVFARVRLDEYMEFGTGAGTDANTVTSLIPGADLDDKSTWETYKFGEDSEFRQYWTMTMADEEDDSVWYMPTFNKDKDSLTADVNGTFDAGFTDYVKYGDGEGETSVRILDAVYDDDDDDADDNGTKTVREEHQIAKTLNGDVISMQEWIDGGSKPGDYWVYDVDGWAYWANAIDPSTATGLLLDGIQRTTKPINEEWYYGINVVAQFITADDLGRDDGTGFYDAEAGAAPTFEALQLLAAIGVKVNVEVSTAEELVEAIAVGGTVTLVDDVTLAEVVAVDKDVVIELNGNDITGTADVFKLEAADGVNLTINGPGKITSGNSESDCAIWSVGNGSAANTIILNNVEVEGSMCGVYHNGNSFGTTVNVVNGTRIESDDVAVFLSGSAAWSDKMNSLVITDSTINGGVSAVEVKQGNVTVTNSTLTANGTPASMVDNGNGSCSSGYALALTNSGTDATTGAFTVNSGMFTGAVGIKDDTDASSITIKGGTFSDDPSKYVADGYAVTVNKAPDDTITGYTVNVY